MAQRTEQLRQASELEKSYDVRWKPWATLSTSRCGDRRTKRVTAYTIAIACHADSRNGAVTRAEHFCTTLARWRSLLFCEKAWRLVGHGHHHEGTCLPGYKML